MVKCTITCRHILDHHHHPEEQMFDKLEIFRIMFTANNSNDHVTMFILYLILQLAVFTFLVKLSGYALASKAKIILHYNFSSMYEFFQENINANLTFTISRKRDSKSAARQSCAHRQSICLVAGP